MENFDYDTDGCTCDEIEWDAIDGYEGCPFCEMVDEMWKEEEL